MHDRKNPDLHLSEMETKVLLEFFPQGICAFDLEMTGLSALFDKIIEIAACKLLPSGEVEFFHELINPLISIPEHTIPYHGLTNEDLRDAPSLKKPLQAFLKFYGHLPLVAHNALFDASFLIRGIHEYNFEISLSSVFDSCRMGRAIYKKHESPPQDFKLSTMASYYNFEFNHHQALDDAIACLKIFAGSLLEYKKQQRKESFKTLSHIFKLSSFQKAENYLLPNKLKDLKDYVQGQIPIKIKYKGGQFKGEFRPIKPISMLPMPQGLVLYAECLQTDMNKYFLVKKIQGFQVTSTS